MCESDASPHLFAVHPIQGVRNRPPILNRRVSRLLLCGSPATLQRSTKALGLGLMRPSSTFHGCYRYMTATRVDAIRCIATQSRSKTLLFTIRMSRITEGSGPNDDRATDPTARPTQLETRLVERSVQLVDENRILLRVDQFEKGANQRFSICGAQAALKHRVLNPHPVSLAQRSNSRQASATFRVFRVDVVGDNKFHQGGVTKGG